MQQKLGAGLISPYFPMQGDGYIDTPVLNVTTALESLARRIDSRRGRSKKQTASSVVGGIERSPEEIY